MTTHPNPPPGIRNQFPQSPDPFGEIPREETPGAIQARKPFPWINLLLFLLTLYTTLLAGAGLLGVNALRNPQGLLIGIPFSLTLMAILLTHEMGHYLASRFHRVEASLPYFIPAPPFFLIGTFGAFIRMNSPITNKKALLDIGAAGPIAGFLVALPASALGLMLSPVIEQSGAVELKLGSPLVFSLFAHLIFGPLPENLDVILHPIAFAGWLGLFITALNLIPIGQLDGGHITYAISGRYHRKVSLGMVPLLMIMGFLGWPGWFLWAVIPLIFGIRHPPLIDRHTPLDRRRVIIGWVSLAILVLSFTPVPFSI